MARAKSDVTSRNVLADMVGGGNEAVESEKNLSLVEQLADGVQISEHVKATTIGLDLPDLLNIDEYESVGKALLSIQSGMAWCIGDWLNHGDNFEWGQTYPKLADMFELDESTLRNYKYVAANVELSIRKRQLSFSHHRLVAHMRPVDQRQWLAVAVKDKLTVKQMRENIRKAEAALNPKPEPKPPTLLQEVRMVYRDYADQYKIALKDKDYDAAIHCADEIQAIAERMKEHAESSRRLRPKNTD